jgi:hypothetical protein
MLDDPSAGSARTALELFEKAIAIDPATRRRRWA